MLRNLRMHLRISAYMHLVDDRIVKGKEFVAARSGPIKSGIHYRALGHEGGAVTLVESEVVARLQLVAEQRRIPLQFAHVSVCMRVQQQLVRIKAMTGIGIVRPVYPE